MNEEQKKHVRRRADGLVKAAWFFSVGSWLFAFAVLLVIEAAAPEREWILPGIEQSVRDTWNATFLPVAFVLLIISLIMCAIAFVFHSRRMKRKSDKVRTKSILIVGTLTLIGLVVFILRFGPTMFF